MIENRKKIIPKGYVSCVMTLFIVAFCVIFIGSSLPPGVNDLEGENPYFPLQKGFSLVYPGTMSQVNAMSFLGTFGAAHGMIFGTGKLLHALADSGIFPRFFHGKTPSTATVYGSIIGFCICILTLMFPQYEAIVFNICVLSGYTTYCSHCLGYIYFKTRFSRLERSFKNPLGIFGAVYAGLVFCFANISIIFFQNDNHIAVLFVVAFWLLMSVIYYAGARKFQIFSKEEQQCLFVAHIIRHNRYLHRQRRRGMSTPFSDSVTGSVPSRILLVRE